MNATQLLIALVAVLAGLLILALIKPYVFKKITIQDLYNELTKRLPHHDFLIKQGEQSRIIVSLNGAQKAIIIMDQPKADYIMGGLPIFTTNKLSHIKHITHKINRLGMVEN